MGILAQWLAPFESGIDIAGFVLFVLVFPVYHTLYPRLVRLFPGRAARAPVDRLRRSWLEGIVERRDVLTAAQQTRNLTMVNSLLASSSLILLGLTANIVAQLPGAAFGEQGAELFGSSREAFLAKLYLLLLLFAVAFAFFVTALRQLGLFTIVIGADPGVVEEEEGSCVDYYARLVSRASSRYTLGIRALYGSFPLFLWLFDSWLFFALTLLWGIKFLGFSDFAHIAPRRPRTPL